VSERHLRNFFAPIHDKFDIIEHRVVVLCRRNWAGFASVQRMNTFTCDHKNTAVY
jgi:hypothetical protein